MALRGEVEVEVGVQVGDAPVPQRDQTLDGQPRPQLVVEVEPGEAIRIARPAVRDEGKAGLAQVTDARVVKVTVDLDAESSQRARRFTNLQVVAKIAPAGPR